MTFVKFVLHLVKQTRQIMKSRFLFPRKFKITGIVLFVIGLAFFFIQQQFDIKIFVWHNLWSPTNGSALSPPDELFDNEIQLSLVLIGLIFIAFSKEKIEDEQIVQLRLESLQWAVYINYAVFFVLIFTMYGLGFFAYTLYNIFTLLLFFIIRFRWAIHRNNKLMEA